MGVFGLSGSGKSTLTHAKHEGKYEVTVLHDDSYIISNEDGSAVALEPAYFDKTQDYPLTAEDNKYLVTIQNCGVTIDDEGKKVPVTEDIRNGNGRAVKSELWASNRTNKMEDPITSIVWLMKDASLPPVMKIEDPILASVMGACLATKRSTAEKLSDNVDRNALVFEPYANPFRTYALSEDYEKFKALFKNRGVDCYILNTGGFLDKDIPKEVTIEIIESIVDGTAKLVNMGGLENVKTIEIDGYTPDFNDKNYLNLIDASIKRRIDFVESLKDAKGGRDSLPEEAINALHLLLLKIKSL
jgi:phosphoenolpyruvate carboxykinase (ATP)